MLHSLSRWIFRRIGGQTSPLNRRVASCPGYVRGPTVKQVDCRAARGNRRSFT